MMATEERWLWRPVPADSLALFRIAFGLMMAVGALRFFAHGWIESLFLAPRFHFTYDGFHFVRPWPAPLLYAHFAIMGVAALAVAAGWRYRLSLGVFLATFVYVELLDKTTYLNHYYLVTLLAALLLLVPLGGIMPRSATQHMLPFWQLGMLRLQVGLVYFFAGISKLKPDWLVAAEPLRTWLPASEGLPLLGPFLTLPGLPLVASWGAALLDLSAPFLLSNRKTRPFIFLALVGFHVVTSLLFNLGLFPFIMLAGATLFFPPDWPRLVYRRTTAALSVAASEWPARIWQRRLVFGTLTVHFAFQSVWPLRHLAYGAGLPGGSDVTWTEDGYRFAWNVMLIEKNGYIAYDVSANGHTWRVYPIDDLTPLQVKMLATQPDFILQYAHEIARQFAARGLKVAVHADSWAALNGRPSARLVDPRVDLTTIESDAGGRWWVLPEDGGIVGQAQR